MKTEKNIFPEMEEQTKDEDVPQWEDFLLPEPDETDKIIAQPDSEESMHSKVQRIMDKNK